MKFENNKNYNINDNTTANNKTEHKKEQQPYQYKEKENKRFWYFPFFSTNLPTQKVRASAGNIWWSLSVWALVFIWCFHAVEEKNWIFLVLGIAAGAAAEFFLVKDFLRTRKKEKEEFNKQKSVENKINRK